MTDDEQEKLIQRFQTLSLLLGYATGLLRLHDSLKKEDEYHEKLAWFNKAIEDVMYLGKPLPKMP